MRHELRLDHPARLVVPAPPRPQHGVHLVDEDNRRRQLPRQREHRRDQLVAVAVPLLRQRRDVQVDEDGAGLVRERLGQHGLAAAGGPVEEDAGGGGEEGRGPRVQAGEGERVDDGFVEVGDEGVEAADVREGDGDFGGVDHFLCDLLLVRRQFEGRAAMVAARGGWSGVVAVG